MKQLLQSWRWYGPDDPVSLMDIRQAGAAGIVTALHHIPNGEVWPVEEILLRKEMIETSGLQWAVVESLPVTEAIKTQTGPWKQHLENYCQSLLNLGQCGIPVITYNFMPVLDWTRTDLDFLLPDGSTALRFDPIAFAAFDLFLLKRPGAANEYPDHAKAEALSYFQKMTAAEKNQLKNTVIMGLPGAEDGYTLQQLQQALDLYNNIDEKLLQKYLIEFLQTVVPVAEEANVKLAIHPDDPPFPLLGLPRIHSTEAHVKFFLEAVDSVANGLCFCTGSYGARPDNDLPAMVRQFGHRINFIHLRSTRRNARGDFYEADHLDGDVDMYAVVKALLDEQQKTRGFHSHAP